MRIQVNTDNFTEGSAKLTSYVESVVDESLAQFGNRITRVEVQLSDENSSRKPGDFDKRCLMEARLAGRKPIAVSHQAATLDQALNGAMDKLEKTLRRAVDKRNNHRGGPKAGDLPS